MTVSTNGSGKNTLFPIQAKDANERLYRSGMCIVYVCVYVL